MIVSSTTLVISEGGSSQLKLRLSEMPDGDVEVAATSSDLSLSVSPPGLTFTALNWADVQAFTIAAAEDSIVESNPQRLNVTLTSTSSTDSHFEGAGIWPAPLVSIEVYSNEVPGVLLSEVEFILVEGGEDATFNVSLLSSPASHDVVVAFSLSNDADLDSRISVHPPSITFSTSDWNSPVEVRVAVNATETVNNYTASAALHVQVTSSDPMYHQATLSDAVVFPRQVIPITVYDLNQAYVSVSAVEGMIELGENFTYTVALSAQPSSPVSVVPSLIGSPSGVSLSPAVVTFTSSAWGPVEVTLVTEPGDSVKGSVAVSVTHTVTSADPAFDDASTSAIAAQSGLTWKNGGGSSVNGVRFVPSRVVQVIAVDDELPYVQLSPPFLFALAGGDNETYSIRLTSAPQAEVTITIGLAASTPQFGFSAVDPSTVSGVVSFFPTTVVLDSSNWSEGVAVQLQVDELPMSINYVLHLNHTVSSADADFNDGFIMPHSHVALFVYDANPVGGMMVSPLSINVLEGGTTTYSIRLSSPPLSSVTVKARIDCSSDPIYDGLDCSSLVSPSPSTVTFLPGDWDQEVVITLSAPADDVFWNPVYGAALPMVATHDVESEDLRYNDTGALIPPGSMHINLVEDEIPGLTLSRGYMAGTEGQNLTLTFTLNSVPREDVVVSFLPSDASRIALSPDVFTVSPLDSLGPHEVTVVLKSVGGIQSIDNTGLLRLVTVHVDSADVMYNDTSYANSYGFEGTPVNPVRSVSIRIFDSAAASVILLRPQLYVSEGSNTTYSVVLAAQPSSDVLVAATVPPAYSSSVSMSPTQLVFTAANWDSPQAFTVSVDHSLDGGELYDVEISHIAVSADAAYAGQVFTPASGVVSLKIYDVDLECFRDCSPGTYAAYDDVIDALACLPCISGYYCAGGCTSPQACPSGTVNINFGSGSLDECTFCPNGTYSFFAGASNCTICPPGYSCEPDTVPALCPPGYSSPGALRECIECLPGTYADHYGATECTDCPAGHSCAQPAESPSLCSPGTYTDDEGATECAPCPGGYSCFSPAAAPQLCPNGTFSLENQAYCLPCPAGMQCLIPYEAPSLCAPGSASLEGEMGCTACAAGTYTNISGSAECNLCPQGHICPDPAASPVVCPAGTSSNGFLCSACPHGSYSPLEGMDICFPCPAGYSCSDGASLTACSEGYVSGEGEGSCARCPAGSFSEDGINCYPCPEGYHCLDPTVGPQLCPYGTSLVISNLTWEDFPCDGNISDSMEAYYARACQPCPAGFECPDPALAPILCPDGTYSGVGEASCTVCPPGFECLDPTLGPVLCNSSSYSLGGASKCELCPGGTRCAHGEPPSPCPSGSYSAPGETECTYCPPGMACYPGAWEPVACSTGYTTFGAGASNCTICPLGLACPSPEVDPVPCLPGHYTPSLGASECDPCPAGSFCTLPYLGPTSCPPGSFSLGEATNCTVCSPGYYCPSRTSAIQLQCPVGSYSLAGAEVCTYCPAGKACPFPAVNLEVVCPPGTYSGGNQTECTPCPAGKYCPDVADVTTIANCPAGRYSDGNQTECTICPAGYKCPDRVSATMEACPNGTYATGGATSCTPCDPGYACPETHSTSLIRPCLPGTYSVGEQTSCTACDPGYECPTSTMASATPCGTGEYALGGEPSCTRCPRGYACPRKDMAPVLCAEGYYASSFSQTECTLCPAGYQCADASIPPVACPVGTWSPQGSILCKACDPGFACLDPGTNTSPHDDICPDGYYCNVLDVLPTGYGTRQIACPAGTYGVKEGGISPEDACAVCPAGSYCVAASTDPQTCPEGYFCPQGTHASDEYACPAGTYNDQQGAVSLADCYACPEGYYCPAGSSTGNDASRICPAGYVCPLGTSDDEQFPCPPGTYSPVTGRWNASQCLECGVGSYCPSGSSSEVRCPPGTYGPSTGQSSSHNCVPCDAGKYCSLFGLDSPEGDCAPGHYCPQGTVQRTDYPCPAGRFTYSTSLTHAAACFVCPEGYYCETGTGADDQPPQNCTGGHYCPAGTGRPEQYPCPPGTYAPENNLYHVSQCTDCPAGSFCRGGMPYIEGDCALGHYCPSNTMLATQFPCPAGRFANRTGTDSMLACYECEPVSVL